MDLSGSMNLERGKLYRFEFEPNEEMVTWGEDNPDNVIIGFKRPGDRVFAEDIIGNIHLNDTVMFIQTAYELEHIWCQFIHRDMVMWVNMNSVELVALDRNGT